MKQKSEIKRTGPELLKRLLRQREMSVFLIILLVVAIVAIAVIVVIFSLRSNLMQAKGKAKVGAVSLVEDETEE